MELEGRQEMVPSLLQILARRLPSLPLHSLNMLLTQTTGTFLLRVFTLSCTPSHISHYSFQALFPCPGQQLST